jgi:heme-degrading monooxygenase HmoA
MFYVIYSFELEADAEAEFVAVWADLTEAIHAHCGGLGSRLHKAASGNYIAYAQWPSKAQWKDSPELPSEFLEKRQMMRSLCKKIEVLQELEMIQDLLKPGPASK